MATPIPLNEARFSAWEIAAASGGRLVHSLFDVVTTSVTSDARTVRPGCAFFALLGERFDGHQFVTEAVSKGATTVVVRRGQGSGVHANVVEVDDTLVAWGDLARLHLARWRQTRNGASVIGITGSAGKTTTRLLTAALLSERRCVLATTGNLNNRVGLPATVFAVTDSHDAAVFELGMSLPDEIAQLAAIAKPDVGVLLNCGIAHAEGVGGTRSDVAYEKGALFATLPRSGVAIVNCMDPAALGQLVRTQARSFRFGSCDGSDARLLAREPTAYGALLSIANGGRHLRVEFPLVGAAAALDFLAALAAAEAIAGQLTEGEIAHALSRVEAIEGRARVLDVGEVKIIDDSYNANPLSMRESLTMAIEVASQAGNARVGLVLGDMKELGPLTVESHRELADLIRDASPGWIILCGAAVRHTYERLEDLGIHVPCVPDAEAALVEAKQRIKSGDVVLVKGSRGIGLERVVVGLSAFVEAR